MKKLKTYLVRFIIYSLTIITFLCLFLIIIDLLIKGFPNIKPELFSLSYSSSNHSMMPAIINTVIMVFLSLLISTPFGIISAIYLNEYAKSNNRIIPLVNVTVQTLSGIPSIVYGLFGYLFFVSYLKWSYSILAGAFTLSIMILPILITSTKEALKSVPNSIREASYGLGAMKLKTIFKIVLPPAMPGILSGVILSIGRIVGETAAVIYTAGSNPKLIKSLLSSGRTLATHVYQLSTEGLYKNEAYATGLILIILVFILNYISTSLARKLSKENK